MTTAAAALKGIFAARGTRPAPPAPPSGGNDDDFAQTILNMSGLVAYWRADSTTAWTDVSPTGMDGSIVGTPALAAAELCGTVTTSDGKALNFNGAGHAVVAHNATLAALTSWTIGCRFRFTAAGIAGEHYVMSKYDAGNGDGKWGLRVRADGSLRLFMNDGAAQYNIDTAVGVIEAGEEYSIIFCGDQLVQFLILNGRSVGFQVASVQNAYGYRNGWTNNTQDLDFGYRRTDLVNSDIEIDEIYLFNRRLTWPEMDTLTEWERGNGYNPAAMNDVGPYATVGTIETAIAAATAGTRVLITPGTYNAVNIAPGNDGGKWNPIVVAADGGTVTFTNATCVLRRGLVIDGINFQSTFLNPVGVNVRYNRLTRGVITNIDNHFIRDQSMSFRMDHCDLSDHQATIGQGIQILPNAGEGYYTLVDHNYFHDAADDGINATEPIGFGSNTADSAEWASITAYRNRVMNWSADDEVFSIKCRGVLSIENTLISTVRSHNSHSRHGAPAWIERDWLKGLQSLGLRIHGGDTVVIGVRVEDTKLQAMAGDVDEVVYRPAPAPDGARPNALRAKLIGCTEVAGAGGFGEIIIGGGGGGIAADQTETWELTGTVTKVAGKHTNTTEHAGIAPISWTLATELAAVNVGPAAADPLVPSGWK